ncbi:MAG TPA: DMT family transporter [Chromatiaceae bacterium]|nr:DMT family transporter [Chromatiaceae bacterium]
MTAGRRLALGAAYVVLGEFMFASMGVGIRFVAAEVPNEVVVFFRNLISVLLLAPWLLRGAGGGLATKVPWLHLLRALAGLGAMYCFFYAIAQIPLAEAMLLKLTTPLFIPLIALLWLGEGITATIGLGVALGFGGVLFVLQPGLAGPSPVALIGLLGGALAAVALVTVRRLSHSEPPTRIVFYFAGLATLVSAVPLPWAWRTPSPAALGWLGAIAILATLGQVCLTRGLSLAPAGQVGPFGYFAVIFGAGYGWLLWQEPLAWGTFVGSALILASGIILTRSPHPTGPTPPIPGPV